MYPKVKRALDFILSLLWLILFWWLLALIALCVKIEDGGRVFFKQRRIGRGKREFYIYKFRTMREDTPKDTPTHLLKNPEKYITKTGAFLRRTSLDELPQIFNILKGDMSFVGPRPALYNQYDLIAERDRVKANDLTPGLTGLAQVNGRDELPIKLKAEYDGKYAEEIGLIADIKILLKTVISVFTAEGIKEGADNGNNNNG